MADPRTRAEDPRAALDRAARALAPVYDEALRERVPPSLERMVTRLDRGDAAAPPSEDIPASGRGALKQRPATGMAVGSAPRRDRRRAAAALSTAAVLVLAAMPLGMAVVQRSSPVFVTLAAVCAVAAAIAERRGDALLDAVRGALRTPLGVAALAFLAWCGVSVAWSGAPATSLHAYGEFLLPCGAALVAAVLLPGRVPRYAFRVVAGALALACLSMWIEMGTGLALRRVLGMRWSTYIFNRPVLTVVVLLAPVLCGLAVLSRRCLLISAVLAVLVAGSAAVSESGAAVLALAVLAGTGLLAWRVPRATVALAAVGLIAAVAIAPVIGDVADRMIPPVVHSELSGSHSRDRVDIWRTFGATIRRAPMLGEGFGSSPTLETSSAAQTLPPEFRPMLAVGHPHNAAVQIWTELGAFGASLALVVLLLTLREVSTLPPRTFVPALTTFAAVAAVSLVGHGAWQGWWAASVGAAVVWLRIAGRQEHVG
jgi:O-antigen ligase